MLVLGSVVLWAMLRNHHAAIVPPCAAPHNARLRFLGNEEHMGEFDAIRPYEDADVTAVMQRLLRDKELLAMLAGYLV